jgi:hypothetical protein
MGRDVDTDKDGKPDHLDWDDDNDGLGTRTEIRDGIDQDTDDDGTPDRLDRDDDNDGVPTRQEHTGAPVDTDGDGIHDHRDTDDDGDHISTAQELADGELFGPDPDGDRIPSYLDRDSDGDGVPDVVEGPDDTDGDGVPDYLQPGSIAGGALCAARPGASNTGAALWMLLLAFVLRVRMRRSRGR